MSEQSGHIQDPEVDGQIALLETQFGDGPHQRERERAAAWLVANADRSYPVIVARIEDGRTSVALIELMPRFARVESVPILKHLLAGPESIAWAAGQALALHPQKAAGDVLRDALAHGGTSVAIVAADALGTRGDRNDCVALAMRIDMRDATVRYHVVQAAGKLGCLARETIADLAEGDSDADVRQLATRLLDKQ